MKPWRLGMTVAAVVLGTMTAWAGELSAGNPGSAARGTDGYAITAPRGDRWQLKSSTDGLVYENRLDGNKFGPTSFAFYRAGFSAAPAPAFTDRASFLAYVKQAVAETSDTDGYMKVQDTFAEKERDGLWLVDCSLNRDNWQEVYPGARDPIVTRIRTRYALDPREPGRVLVVWYAWHGVLYDENRFESEAAVFLNSLRQTQ